MVSAVLTLLTNRILDEKSALGNPFYCIIISLSCHEQVCLSGLRFERYFSHHPDFTEGK